MKKEEWEIPALPKALPKALPNDLLGLPKDLPNDLLGLYLLINFK